MTAVVPPGIQQRPHQPAAKVVDGKGVFGFVNRGIDKRIAVDGEHGLNETELALADSAVEKCPTGCLTRKRQGFDVPVGKRDYDTTPIGSDIEQKQSAN